MLKRARRVLADRPARGLAASIVLHAVFVGLALFMALPVGRYAVKRGEPLFVELPDLPEPAPAGNPAARSMRPARPEKPPAQPAPRPRSAPPAEPAPTPTATPPVEASPLVASRPAPPSPAPAAEPPAVETGEPGAPASETPSAPPSERLSPPAPPARAPAPPQVAAAPPPTAAPPVDIRSALGRGASAGSVHGGGRGGIEGEPIPLDSSEPDFSDYLDRVRRQIKANWGYPCIKNLETRECEYKTASLVVVFGILKAGRLQFVEVLHPSGLTIYDDYAVNAIKLGSPFPPVPAALMARAKAGSPGVPIQATFIYTVQTSLTHILR